MRIEIPGLPPVACSPNARLHWAAKAKAARSWGSTVFYCAVDARNREAEPTKWRDLAHATLQETYILPNNRRRDTDNLQSANKSGRDALVRCGILKDDDHKHLTLLRPLIEVDPKRGPMTVLEITPCEGK